ncbi:hypothetical protein [Roseibium marinum]|uniref:hypothetical protein n=1 Tax=Roseibium marinum TaxID=281252 RepID=UPI000CD1EFBD|nr:hypothetical protein [Roseibium marinum]
MSAKSTNIDDVADIVDFFLAWNYHRQTVIQICEIGDLSEQQKKTLSWLVKMADRVSLSDLEKEDRD